eukprot:207943-Chlamydomonas_euryale.AAC.1
MELDAGVVGAASGHPTGAAAAAAAAIAAARAASEGAVTSGLRWLALQVWGWVCVPMCGRPNVPHVVVR